MNHTPTPWQCATTKGGIPAIYGSRRHSPVCYFGQGIDETLSVLPGDKANAEFIVRAVNAHDELVALVRDLRAAIGTYAVRESDGQLHPMLIAAHNAATAALAKAGVKP